MAKDTPLIDVSEARQRLLAHFSPLESIQIPLATAVGRVLAQPVSAPMPLAPFDNSSMDGFAVQAADLIGASREKPVCFEAVADIPAGKRTESLIGHREMVRGMTGAMLPGGAHTVAPVEYTDFGARQSGIPAPKSVFVDKRFNTGDNVRLAGSYASRGATLLPPGRWIRPQDARLLGVIGMANVSVRRKPRVAVFSSGDELLPVEAEHKLGQYAVRKTIHVW